MTSHVIVEEAAWSQGRVAAWLERWTCNVVVLVPLFL